MCSLGPLCCVFQVLKKRWVKITEVTLFFPKFLPFRQFLYSVFIVSLNTVLHLQWVHISTPSCSCDCKLKVAIFGVIRGKAESEGLGRTVVVESRLPSRMLAVCVPVPCAVLCALCVSFALTPSAWPPSCFTGDQGPGRPCALGRATGSALGRARAGSQVSRSSSWLRRRTRFYFALRIGGPQRRSDTHSP